MKLSVNDFTWYFLWSLFLLQFVAFSLVCAIASRLSCRARAKGGELLLLIPSARPAPRLRAPRLLLGCYVAFVAITILQWGFGSQAPPSAVMVVWLPAVATSQYLMERKAHQEPRLEIRENGLLWGGGLLPWSRIRTYELRETKTDDRLLVLKGRQEFIGSIEVPNEYAEDVEQLLLQHVGDAAAVAVGYGSSAKRRQGIDL